MNRSQLPTLIDNERTKLERKGVRAAQLIAGRARRAAIVAYRAGNDPVIAARAVMAESESGVVPLLVDAMVAAHLTGRHRSDLQAAPRFTRRIVRTFATTYEGTIDFMARRMDATATELEILGRQYGEAALKMSRDASAALERELAETTMKAMLEGIDTRKGVTALRDAFRRAGFSPEADYRLETMFRTQTQIAYSAGRENAWRDPVIDEILWGYEYATIGDDRVRPTHAAMDGVRAPKDDPIWSMWPIPAGWNCRCTKLEIFIDEPKYAVATEIPNVQPDAGFNFNPGDVYRDLIGTRKAA